MTEKPLRFPRSIRLDESDVSVFESAAAPGEWAVSGAFAFSQLTPEDLQGKTRQAFAHGFLGLESFGRSTLVTVTDIDRESYEGIIDLLARHFVEHYGAPDMAAARPAAEEEAAFAASLCDHPINTLLAVSRELEDRGIVESFRVITPEGPKSHAKIWEIVEQESDPDDDALQNES
ncbi:DUF6505 family protein [Denitrobaculum tricleocarpae]|uniref:DUF6505 family protein n=1 Tax=Denitrobaculum tricleocarpae TaxID=2591009 RepID=UPI001FEC4300|nr:DUF6505 family protein [Denitrobaculum tricleocarpae]